MMLRIYFLPGPTMKPKTWARESIETAPVLSLRVVADETYERQIAMLAERIYKCTQIRYA